MKNIEVTLRARGPESPTERLPLSSVRTFVVVARLLSITRAAEELNVTPSAVSHQMKALEDYLGTSLFRREKNRLRLSAAGQQFMPHANEALALLSRATRAIRTARGQQILRVGAPASIAALWLVGRLGRFMEQHPDVSLHLTSCANLTALLHASVDVGLLYGNCTLPGWSCEPLGQNRLFPVCSPLRLKREGAPRTPADLSECVLLDSSDDTYYDQPRQPDWHGWLEAAGVPEVTGTRYLAFTPRALMHPAVCAGYGVGLTRSLLAVDAIVAKQLVVPFGPAPVQSLTYHVAYPDAGRRRKDVVAFRDWVLHEAHTSTRQMEHVLKRVIGRQSGRRQVRANQPGKPPADEHLVGSERTLAQAVSGQEPDELRLAFGAGLGEKARKL